MLCEDALTRIRDLAYQMVGRGNIPIVLDPDPTADNFQALQDQLDAIPDGTADHPTVAVLPVGEFPIVGYQSNTSGNRLSQKRHVRLTGPGCTLRWVDYGPLFNGLYARRHFNISACHKVEADGFQIMGAHDAVSAKPDRAQYWSDHAFYTPSTRDAPLVEAKSCLELTVEGCTAARPVDHSHSAKSPLVRINDAGLAGSVTVRDNTAINFITALGENLTNAELDVMVPNVVWNVGDNDLGDTVEQVPDWIESRL